MNKTKEKSHMITSLVADKESDKFQHLVKKRKKKN